jgi:hypothetical protein
MEEVRTHKVNFGRRPLVNVVGARGKILDTSNSMKNWLRISKSTYKTLERHRSIM